jgi:hypothetical protein
MPIFTGTRQEFRRFIGPFLRNLVQQITKAHRKAVAACEHCGSGTNLEAAHIKGRNRSHLIELLLSGQGDEVVSVDLVDFEKNFKQEHKPVERSILILCKNCHRVYDSAITNLTTQEFPLQTNTSSQEALVSSNLSRNDRLPITLHPQIVEDFKRKLLETRRAIMKIYYANGKIETKIWNATKLSQDSNIFGNLRSRPEFRVGAWQKKGIVKLHVSLASDVEIDGIT